VRPRYLFVIPAVYLPWLALAVLQKVPDQNSGTRLIVLSEMLLAMVLGCVQARVTRDDPRDRAALRWLGLSILVGSGLFVFTTVATRIFGWFPPLEQGYAFGFFLLMDFGLVLGLRRYRLFELDEWAYRVLFWVGGALLLLLLDGVALFFLKLDETSSLGLALLVSGFVYLPLRGFLWARLVSRRDLDQPALFQSLLEVSFGVTDAERSDRWVALVRRIFDPLVIEPAAESSSVTRVQRESDGLALTLPPVASTPALRVSHPWRGRALFGPRHLRLAESVVSILMNAEASRGAYDRGVQEERLRIARDLHDDVGARLLSGLQEADLERAREAMRHAISDMRSIVTALTGTRVPLDELLGDLRHETHERLSVAGLELAWPLPEAMPDRALSHHVGRHFVSMLREVISNVIRHARARRVEVAVALEGGMLVTRVHDDGAGFSGEAGEGHGLLNLTRRAAEAGGEVRLPDRGAETALEIRLPVEALS
jgi:signal transduction histidine kinase